MKKSQKQQMSKEKEAGKVIAFFSGVAKIQGLSRVFLHEVLVDEKNGSVGVVIGFNEKFVEALFFDEEYDAEKQIFRSGQSFSIRASDKLIGRVVDGRGRARDGLGEIQGKETAVFRQAPGIIDREPVTVPLTTGIKIIDTNLPLGRGQRELIIGDRKLGKSTIALDVILNQKHADPAVYCIYVVCGQKEQEIQELVARLEEQNAFLYTMVVAAGAGTSFVEQYLAPFTGCALGEYFRDNGQDALVVYDDLSKHAKIYRDVSLLLERTPGREAYPGDIFSLHAGLLERAAKLAKEKGGGSLTALPIVETQAGDITAFIPTNLISITDGQIYLEGGLFHKGFLPAVNVGLSVSRIGSKVQPRILKDVVGGIRLALAQHKELQKLSQLETAVSREGQRNIRRGVLMLDLLKQGKHTNVTWPEQVVLFYAVEQGYLDDIDESKWSNFEKLLLELIRNRYDEVLKKIYQGSFDKKVEAEIQDIIKDFKQEFLMPKEKP